MGRAFVRLVNRQLRFVGILGLVLGGFYASARPPDAELLAVSKPPASLLPTDPVQGLVYGASPDLASADVFFSTEGGPVDLTYIVLDSLGNGYLTFDDGPNEEAAGGVMVVDKLKTRTNLTFDKARDRLITGDKTGLSEPKDLFLVEDLGLLIVADFAGTTIKVFDTLASGNVAPHFSTDRLGMSLGSEPRRPWGLAYDETDDRLFVGATDGSVLVYDNFLARQGENGPDRVITPTWQGETVSHNLHELIYLRGQDKLVVTDVGAATTSDQPGFDSDGALLVLEGASQADGTVPVALRVAGQASMLGNPVSLVKRGEAIFVAENGLDLLLRFDGLLAHRGSVDLSPNAAISMVKPESLVLLPQ